MLLLKELRGFCGLAVMLWSPAHTVVFRPFIPLEARLTGPLWLLFWVEGCRPGLERGNAVG